MRNSLSSSFLRFVHTDVYIPGMPLCSFFSFLSFFFFFRRDQKETERDGDLWELDTTPEVIDRLIYWTSRVSPLPVFFNLFLSRSEKKF